MNKTKVLVLYYSAYGHIEAMAQAVAAGVREVQDCEATIKRVPELVPEAVALKSGLKLDQAAPIAQPNELADYDAVIFGTPTRFGNMCGQMRQFLDATGGLWAKGALVGKVGSVIASSGTQHGGQESTLLSFHISLLHHGMVVAGLPYAFVGQMGVSEITGGSPYGATTIAGGQGERMPSANELDGARFQGRYVAGLAGRLAGFKIARASEAP